MIELIIIIVIIIHESVKPHSKEWFNILTHWLSQLSQVGSN